MIASDQGCLGGRSGPTRRFLSSRVVQPWVLMVCACLILGCTSGTPAQPPIVQLSAKPGPPVGQVIPILVKRDCTANCGITSTPLTRQQIGALNESGQYIPAISVDDAIKLAGGAGNLLDAVNARESRAITIARESTFEAQNTSGSIFAVFAVPLALAGAASKANLSDEDVERMRLREVAIPECPYTDVAHGCSIRSNFPALHHDPSLGGDHGWVFFPMGKYTRVKACYDWQPSFSASENQTEVVEAELNGASSTSGAALSASREAP